MLWDEGIRQILAAIFKRPGRTTCDWVFVFRNDQIDLIPLTIRLKTGKVLRIYSEAELVTGLTSEQITRMAIEASNMSETPNDEPTTR